MTPFLVAPQFTPRTVPAQPSSVKRAPDAGPRPDFARRSKTHVLASDSILLLVAISLTLACTTDFGGFSASRLSLGSIICALGWLPTIVYLRQANAPPVPLLPFTGLFYFAACGLPAFYDFGAASVQDAWHIEPKRGGLNHGHLRTPRSLCRLLFSFGYKITPALPVPFLYRAGRPVTTFDKLPMGVLALHLGALIFRGHVVESALGRSVYAAGLFCVWHASDPMAPASDWAASKTSRSTACSVVEVSYPFRFRFHSHHSIYFMLVSTPCYLDGTSTDTYSAGALRLSLVCSAQLCEDRNTGL